MIKTLCDVQWCAAVLPDGLNQLPMREILFTGMLTTVNLEGK
jgi:hypothetical protein